MQRSIPIIVMCLMSCFFVPSALAAETGTLRLTRLPAGTRIYVDGKPVQAVGNALMLPTGIHALQLETLAKDGSVLADRRTIQVEASAALAVTAHWLPVTLAPWWPYRRERQTTFEYLPAPWGPLGPEGPEGLAGRSCKGWSGPPADAEILRTLKEALLLRLDELDAKTEDSAIRLLDPAWRIHNYVYDSGAIRPEPRGPSGSPGEQGSAGLPADVFALEDTQGRKMLNEAVRLLNLPMVAQAVNALTQRSTPLASTGDGLPPRLRLLTPEWRVQYEQKRAHGRKASLAAPTWEGTICPSGALGPHGPHGAKGADGVLPANAVKVRFDLAHSQRVLALLQADPEVNARIQQLQAHIVRTRKDIDAAVESSPMLTSGN